MKRGAGSKNSDENSKTVVKIKKTTRLRLDRSEPSDESEGSDLIAMKLITATRFKIKR